MDHESALTLPVAPCPECDETRLLRAILNTHDDLTHVCTNCETPIEESAIEWKTIEEINKSGYITEGWVDPHGKRGCRGGACGIQQPA